MTALLPEVSVVIPTYNRALRLVRCLERLAEQTLPRERFEVVVVSDGSTDDTVVAARAAGTRLGFDLVAIETDHGGPGHARNEGVRRARAALIAFTDDDVVVSPEWLAAGIGRFADASVGGVEGLTEAVLGEESIYRFNVANTEGGKYPTCNIFYRRAVLEAVGGFDVRFRRAREDSDLAYRVLDAGHSIVFEPRARVAHPSHLSSPRHPLFVASALPDSILLRAKHPRRDQLRPRFYRSDVVKIGLAVAATLALAVGAPLAALAAGLGYAALAVRTFLIEVVPARVLVPRLLLALTAVYLVLPFAHLLYYVRGTLRVRRGVAPTRPV